MVSWITPFLNWISNLAPLPSDFNRIEGNIQYLKDRGDTGRTLSLYGDVSGSTTYDDNAGMSVNTVVADNSHKHVSSNISDAESSAIASTIVKRDSAGNFLGNIIGANRFDGALNGNANTATSAQTSQSAGTAGYATSAGHADSATNASEATHAASADNANYATSAHSAEIATSAGSATNAGYATSSGLADTSNWTHANLISYIEYPNPFPGVTGYEGKMVKYKNQSGLITLNICAVGQWINIGSL